MIMFKFHKSFNCQRGRLLPAAPWLGVVVMGTNHG
jgi:hypothetical protein